MRKVPRLMTDDEIKLYNYDQTKYNVKSYFSKYRNYKDKLDLIKDRYSGSLSNDNMGIFSSNISNPTANKVEQSERYNNYIDLMDKHITVLKNHLTKDEKIILKMSILSSYTDEAVCEQLSIYIQNFYQRKKSTYIKVACYFGIDVEIDT